MKLAYADPPYLGAARRYRDFHPDWKAWDNIDSHDELIRILNKEYDRWALSCSQQTLKRIFLLLPADVTIGAWIKKPVASRSRISTWEPVIFHPRPRGKWRDSLVDYSFEATKMPGVKTVPFAKWVLDGLGLEDGDTFTDVFPGSSIMDMVSKQKRLLL